MGLTHSPSLITDGLILNVDAANIKSFPVQRNLLQSSTNFNITWANNASIVKTINAGEAPDGTNTAARFDTSSNTAGVYQYVTISENQTYTYSVFLKYISGNPVVSFGSDNVIVARILFNTSNGTWTVGSGSPFNIGVINVGNGWYRLFFSISTTSATSLPMIVYSSSVVPSSFLVWGPQIERGALSSYFPTTNFTSIYDMSSNGIDGVLAGGASYNYLNGGNILMDGVNGRITHTTNLIPLHNFTGSTSFTMSAFIKLNSFPAVSIYNSAGILQKNSYDKSFGMNLVFTGDTGGFRNTVDLYCGIRNIWYASTTAPSGYGHVYIQSTAPILLNTWYKIDFVHSFVSKTHTVSVYLDGVLFSTYSETNERFPIDISNTASLAVNNQILGGNFLYANLSISNYQIYSRALSAAEILQNYNALRGRFGK